MPVRILYIQSASELLDAEVACVRELLSAHGRVSFVCPTATAVDTARRSLANAGVPLGVDVLTPARLTEGLWERFGDGRRLVDAHRRTMLMDAMLRSAPEEELAPIRFNPGTVVLACRIAREVLPELLGTADEDAGSRMAAGECAGVDARHAPLSAAEKRLAAQLARYRDELERRGLVEACEANALLARAVKERCLPVGATGAVVLRGVTSLPEHFCRLLAALAARAEVAVLLVPGAVQLGRDLRMRFEAAGVAVEEGYLSGCGGAGDVAGRVERLFALPADGAGETEGEHATLDAASSGEGGAVASAATGDGSAALDAPLHAPWLSFAEVAGPSAAPEAYARVVAACCEASAERGAASGETGGGARAGDGLADIAAREFAGAPFVSPAGAAGVQTGDESAPCPKDVIVTSPQPLRAFRMLAERLAHEGIATRCSVRLSFSETQAGMHFYRLIDLTRRMREEPVSAWWCAPELSDWLMSPLSGVPLSEARAFDKRLRGKRQLDAEAVLRGLQGVQSTCRNRLRERGAEGREVVAFDVVYALMRGRYSEALAALGDAAAALPASAYGEAGTAVERAACARATEFLRDAFAECIKVESALVALKELPVRAAVECVPASSAGAPSGLPVLDGVPASLMFDNASASPAAFPAPLVELMTLAEAAELATGSADALVMLDVDAASYPLVRREGADAALAEKLGAPALLLEPAALMRDRFRRALRAARGRVVLARMAHDGQGDELYPAAMWTELACRVRPGSLGVALPDENRIASNIAPEAQVETVRRAAEGTLSPQSLPFLLPLVCGEDGSLVRRRFSASQIENYLNCPYQWFLSSRVSPRSLDAGFGSVEKGNLVHDVMQRFHEELAASPLARVTPENLERALPLLDEVFAQVRAEHARAKTATSAPLVPQTPVEEFEADAILRDLRRAVRFEAELLPPFRPAYAEYAFDALDVEYAGVPLGGRIDRIDVDAEGRAVVIDYKHRASIGEYRLKDPTTALESGQGLDPAWLPRHVQALVYAQAVRRALGLDVQGALYFGTKGAVMTGAVSDALVGMVPGMRDGFPGEGGSLSFTDLLDLVEERVGERLAALAQGDIAPSDDASSCRFCPAFGCAKRKE